MGTAEAGHPGVYPNGNGGGERSIGIRHGGECIGGRGPAGGSALAEQGGMGDARNSERTDRTGSRHAAVVSDDACQDRVDQALRGLSFAGIEVCATPEHR